MKIVITIVFVFFAFFLSAQERSNLFIGEWEVSDPRFIDDVPDENTALADSILELVTLTRFNFLNDSVLIIHSPWKELNLDTSIYYGISGERLFIRKSSEQFYFLEPTKQNKELYWIFDEYLVFNLIWVDDN